MSLQSKLKGMLKDFFKSGDASNLELLVESHPELIAKNFGDYPDFHRVVDVQIGDKHYRICRQISAGESLTFSPIDKARDEPGVPIWLEGEKLKAWAHDEVENPSDDPTDWDVYR